MQRVLVVDDRAAGREIIGKQLVQRCFSVLFATDVRETHMLLETEHLDLIVTDHREGGIDAIELVKRVRSVSRVPIIVLAAVASVPECESAMRAGADRFLVLSNDLDRLADVSQELAAWGKESRDVPDLLTTEEARALGRTELREVLQRMIVECRGNVAEIARRMNRDRSTIRYHLLQMGLLDGRDRRAAVGMRRQDPGAEEICDDVL